MVNSEALRHSVNTVAMCQQLSGTGTGCCSVESDLLPSWRQHGHCHSATLTAVYTALIIDDITFTKYVGTLQPRPIKHSEVHIICNQYRAATYRHGGSVYCTVQSGLRCGHLHCTLQRATCPHQVRPRAQPRTLVNTVTAGC